MNAVPAIFREVRAPHARHPLATIPMLASLDLTGCVVTADAPHRHPAMARIVHPVVSCIVSHRDRVLL
ncbi:hypothetical protein [Methylobacterium sp. SyP6R]|uniref:hypothetical protein n=1 Tax=Methylobacterium sp. SyP6R TaxID=2718876 RepID=UPI001F216A61|nr:hypothetical protein [Methylobacterium sp. SyP6R]MCF4126089.1 hypothetical protein [Methylobacterium sp. SyP6R]